MTLNEHTEFIVWFWVSRSTGHWSHYYPLSRCITQSNKASGHVSWNPNTDSNHYTFSTRFTTLESFHTCALKTEGQCVYVWVGGCFPVCLQSAAGSPVTLGPKLEKSVCAIASIPKRYTALKKRDDFIDSNHSVCDYIFFSYTQQFDLIFFFFLSWANLIKTEIFPMALWFHENLWHFETTQRKHWSIYRIWPTHIMDTMFCRSFPHRKQNKLFNCDVYIQWPLH